MFIKRLDFNKKKKKETILKILPFSHPFYFILLLLFCLSQIYNLSIYSTFLLLFIILTIFITIIRNL